MYVREPLDQKYPKLQGRLNNGTYVSFIRARGESMKADVMNDDCGLEVVSLFKRDPNFEPGVKSLQSKHEGVRLLGSVGLSFRSILFRKICIPDLVATKCVVTRKSFSRKTGKDCDWQTLLNLVSRGELGELYLWVQPTEQDLRFLARELTSAGIQRVLSVGCGTGLLEWLLQSVTGLQVKGLEVDRSWWESPYSPPTFIPLHYADEDDVICSPHTALLFCYFNNRPAFLNYMASFTGRCLVVIGPGEGSGRHTDPLPFDSQLHDMGWTVQSATKIQNTMDYIVIYRPQSLPQ